MAYASSTEIELSEIPVLDISALRRDDSGTEAAAAIGEKILEAATTIGFFYVSGHGVADSVFERANQASREFFKQPREIKEEVAVNANHRGFLSIGEAQMYGAKHVDLKESWIWSIENDDLQRIPAPDDEFLGHNQWPSEPAQFRPAMVEFFNSASAVAVDLMRAFAVSMNLKEDAFLKTARNPVSRGASVYYPPQPADLGEEQFGVAPHTDYGCLTLVWQDEVGGLEVRNANGDWVTAHPIENTFVVNVGDLLARWTNQHFKSTPHRVVNRSGKERCSMALFWDPDSDTVIDPSAVVAPDEKIRYKPTTVAEHILKRYGQSFSYRSTDTDADGSQD